MGLCPSKSAVWKGRLENVKQRIMIRKPWRRTATAGQPPDLTELGLAVNDLEQCHGFFESDGKDREALGIIQHLANALVEELHSLMDPRLIPYHRQSLERLVRLSKQLNNFRANKSDFVLQKYKELVSDELRRLLEAGDQSMSVCDAKSLLPVSKKALLSLEGAAQLVPEAPEMQGAYVKTCIRFCEMHLVLFPITIDEQPRDVTELMDLAQRADSTLRPRVDRRNVWPPLAPQMKEVRDTVTLRVASAKVEELEAICATDVNVTLALKLLEQYVALHVKTGPEEATKLRGSISKLAATIQSAFEQAIDAGDTAGMQRHLQSAKDLEERHQKCFPSGDPLAIAKSLEQRKAGVTLKSILGNAERHVGSESQELHKLFLEAEASFKKIDPEQLDRLATGARWRFRLASGKFKDYSEEKTSEVEGLYQSWCSKGKPSSKQDCRFNITIQVRSAGGPPTASSGTRPKCKFGEKCYRKNPDHRREMSHPGDTDWEVPEDNPPESGEGEVYSLDFHLMTQVNLTRGRAMRVIKRDEGMTWAQKITHVYNDKVTAFVKDAEDTLSQAEAELHLLGGAERSAMQTQADALVAAMRPVLVEFCQLAVAANDKKAIEQVIALLGHHADTLKLKDIIKEVRLSDVIRELSQANAVAPGKATDRHRWNLLRMLCTKQKAGPRNLLKCRLSLVNAKRERFKLTTRRAGMRCQALLSEYEEDEEFCRKIRQEVAKVLHQRLQIAVEHLDLEVVQSTLRAAVSLQCDVEPMLEPAGHLVLSLVSSAARCRPVNILVEVLDGVDGVAKAANRPLQSFCDLTSLVRPVVQKVFQEVQIANQGAGEALPNMVKKVVGVRAPFKAWELAEAFDMSLWDVFEPWYRELKTGSLEERTAAAEFAIAYTEQLKISMPKWLLDKDQVTVLRTLKEAVESGNEKALREAVVAAKQTDFGEADETLSKALTSQYEEALAKLRRLKRLPSGWEVTELVGDDASMKMFKKADLDDPRLKEKFQQLFDKTMKASIVTRDRAARGAGEMPRGYRVEKIVSVMNAESWKSYQERQDFIAKDCLRYPGCAPMGEKEWADWSGKVHTAAHGNDIMEGAHLPSLNAGANEFLMFHGTKPEAADLIAMNHFDMAFACKTGLFGAGLYFAENSSKSDEYVKGDHKGWYPMILCRVTLGRIYYCANADPTTDPGRDKLEDACTSGAYHCVLGDRVKARGTYREYVIYDHYQVYPQFIVWYTRI